MAFGNYMLEMAFGNYKIRNGILKLQNQKWHLEMTKPEMGDQK